MELLAFIKFGYILVIATFLLIIWVSLAESRESELFRDPPCYFNPLCSCSKGVPDLGMVRCQNLHLPKIPDTINISKVFTLHMENNGLRTLEPFFLQSTGLYKIVISKNPLSFIPDEAFLGLERSLWELDLSHNQLTRVPNRALRYLQKLRRLDLRGNNILKISPDDWRGLQSSLVTLILSDNCINALTVDLFSGLPLLETIDLRGNHLRDVDPSVFRDGMGKLVNLILADNQLSSIPYQALSYLKSLRNLDLSYNNIHRILPSTEAENVFTTFQLNLNKLHLDYNQITTLDSFSFQYFNVINQTFLDGNPIEEVKEGCFRQAKIKEIYMRNCGLKSIAPEAFDGMENYLEVLDLSGNSLQALSEVIFNKLDWLKSISVKDNLLSKINVIDAFIGSQDTLNAIDLSGGKNAAVKLQDFKRLRNLRTLTLSRLTQTSLSAGDFAEFGTDIEELNINFAGLQKINNNAFKHLHGIKKINFAENSISKIEKDAFNEIGHSLISLNLCNGFSSSMKNVPADGFKALTNLEELDLSNNKIGVLPDTSIYFMRNLKKLYLHDNVIELIHKGTFQGDIHRELEELYFSFNSVKLIQQHTFVDLVSLDQLYLDENKIASLEKRAFLNLANLRVLNLRGNKIITVAHETFQNLPQLESLDMSYNKLSSFDFGTFDQVGTLSILNVNVSHNKLINLAVTAPSTVEADLGASRQHSNIKTLDMSFNNITTIAKNFFKPAELSLTHLYLGHNQILNGTKDVFGNMPHLQLLDISYNHMYGMDFDAFRNTKKLQVLIASHNLIAEVPNDLFRFVNYLRVVDFSHNRLRTLPDNLFREEGLEHLDVSHNLLSKLPLTSFSIMSAMSLSELDLSWNSISSLAHGGLLERFKKLSWLDLSYNRLAQIDAGTFKGLPRLTSLNLGHNSQLALEANGLSFQGLEYSLTDLNLDNVSTSLVPRLPTHNLLFLSLAYNSIPVVPPEIATNISSLQSLNLNYNDLTSVPLVTHSLTELQSLAISGNPITTLTNTSLLGVASHLEELDIRNTAITTFEMGAFCKMHSLRTLRMNLYPVKNFNVPTVLFNNNGLKNLEIHMDKESDLFEKQLIGTYPRKLQNITLTGKGIRKLGSKMFQGIRSPLLHLCIHNTSLSKIAVDIFQNVGRARNLTVDVRGNVGLKSLHNPSTGSSPNLYRSTFLIDLKLSGSKWTCDCDIGWVEVWQRKQRQYICRTRQDSIYYSAFDACKNAYTDLRSTLCSNKNNQSLIEILKSEIECGWSSAYCVQISLIFTIFCILLSNLF